MNQISLEKLSSSHQAHQGHMPSAVLGVFVWPHWWPSHAGLLLEGTSLLVAMLWPAKGHTSVQLLLPPSMGCTGMICLILLKPHQCPVQNRADCPSPKREKQMLSCLSEAHAAEPGLKPAGFWPESDPGSLVFSYFCLACSISQMKDIQSPDSLPLWAFWLLRAVISPMGCCYNFCWV